MECSIDLHHSPSANHYLKPSDCANLLLVSCDTTDPLEPFRLSTLHSPISRLYARKDFAALSECSSPYPELIEGITTDRSTESKKGGSAINLDCLLYTSPSPRDS